jgi:hypothetical protein
MTLNEMKIRRASPSALFPPTIKAFFAVDEGLRISSNLLKTWWPGTELNRRRQPFQGCALPPELPGHPDELSACSRGELFVTRLVWRGLPSWVGNQKTRFACGTLEL